MKDLQFCYCCRVHHERHLMQLFETRHGLRWRCRASIEAARADRAARDAFGQQQSEFNREAASQAASRAARSRVERERLAGL